jgi:hypothetical protein
VAEARTEHSQLGIASFVVSLVPGILFLVFALMVEYAVSKQPPDADTVAYGFWMLMLAVWTVLTEIVALGLGIAGVLQRRHKRLFAVLGVGCSILVLVVILSQIGLANFATRVVGLTEPQPKVHVVSNGNE